MRFLPGIALVAAAALAACGPISPTRAADICEDRARKATAPYGRAVIAANSAGETYTGLKIGITSDFIRGRDPYVVYDQCVRELSGQGPIRPLTL